MSMCTKKLDKITRTVLALKKKVHAIISLRVTKTLLTRGYLLVFKNRSSLMVFILHLVS